MTTFVSKTDFMAWFPNGAPSNVRSDTPICWAFSDKCNGAAVGKINHFTLSSVDLQPSVDTFRLN